MGRHYAPTKRELRAEKKAAALAAKQAEQAERDLTLAAHTTEAASASTPTDVPERAAAMAATPKLSPAPAAMAAAEAPAGRPGTFDNAPLGLQVRGPFKSGSTRLAAVGVGAIVLGTTVGFVNLGKQVDVVIDGQSQSITTYASDVEGVLTDAGVEAGPQDAVTPSLDSKVSDGSTVSLVKSREVSVVIDGESTVKTVTAYTTAEALDQLGLGDHELVSSRSQRLPLEGASIELATNDDVTISADGTDQVITTTAADVAEALADAGITLGEHDTVTPALDAKVTAGMTIKVARVDATTTTETRTLKHKTVEQPNPDEYVGIDTVLTKGSDGTETVTYRIETVDGAKSTKTETGSEVTKKPVDEVISKGTKEFPADVNALNWEALGYCESTNNPKAVNLTNHMYFGEYQFSEQTWAGVGGTGNPADAPAEEQLARAKMLYMAYGAGQWECGSHLYD